MRPIVINRAGAIAMEAASTFKHTIAPSIGLRDVFRMKREYLAKEFEMSDFTFEWEGKEVKGVKVDKKVVPSEYELPSKEEIDDYIRKREEYVALEVLHKCGWEEFVKRCELARIEDFIHKHVPCEGPAGQCSVLCHRYGLENCWKPFFD